MVRKACELLDRAVVDTNMISCHLGAGCSVTATKGHDFCLNVLPKFLFLSIKHI